MSASLIVMTHGNESEPTLKALVEQAFGERQSLRGRRRDTDADAPAAVASPPPCADGATFGDLSHLPLAARDATVTPWRLLRELSLTVSHRHGTARRAR
jgi:hypothetical protein